MLKEGVRVSKRSSYKWLCLFLGFGFAQCNNPADNLGEQTVDINRKFSRQELEQVLRKFESEDDLDEIADSLWNIPFDTNDQVTSYRLQYTMAVYYLRKGKQSESFKLANALAKREALSKEIEPLLYRLLAVHSHFNGDYRQSINYINKALHFDSINSDTVGLIKDFANKSTFYHFLEEYENSLSAQLKSAEIWSQYSDSALVENPLLDIAPIYLELGDSVRAQHYLRKTVESATSQTGLNSAWLNYGKFYENQGRFITADSIYFQLLNSQNLSGDSSSLHIVLNNIAYNSRNLGRMDTAFKYLDKSISVRDKIEKSETSRKLKELELERIDLKKDLQLSRLENEAKQSRVNFIITLAFFILFSVGGTLIGITMRTKIRAQRQINEAQKRNAEKERELAAMHASLQAIDHERSRIAMDLHDGIGMHASLARLRLSQMESDNMSAKEQSIIDELNGTLGEIAMDTKRITNDLMPSSLSNLGLEFAIEEIAERMNELNDVEVKFEAENIEPLEPNKTRVIYRIAQELLNNGVKHSKGTEVLLKMKMNNSGLYISYLDNGQGIDSSALNGKGKGHGLKILKSRVEHLSGEIDIASNNGTQINVKIPLANAG